MIGIYEFQCLFNSQATTKHRNINCYVFSGNYYIAGITANGNDYNYFTNIVDDIYNYFTNITMEDEDKILITYLSPCLGEVDTGEMALILERIDDVGNIRYECINSLVNENIILHYPDDYFTYNQFFDGYQINGYFLISNKYPALFDIVVEEVDIFGYTFKTQSSHEKIKKFLRDGLIYIYFGDIQLTYHENRTIKYYFYPDTHIKKFSIIINKRVFKQELINIGFFINLYTEVDSYDFKSLPIFIIKTNPFDNSLDE